MKDESIRGFWQCRSFAKIQAHMIISMGRGKQIRFSNLN